MLRHLPWSFFIGVCLSLVGMTCLGISYANWVNRPRTPRPLRLSAATITERLASPEAGPGATIGSLPDDVRAAIVEPKA